MSNDPSQQPTSGDPTSSLDGNVPPVIPDSGQPPSPDGSAAITPAEEVSTEAKPELPSSLSEKAVEARVRQIRMQRLRQAEQPTPEEDRERAIYELQLPWWQKFYQWTGIPEKKGWDLAQLLAVPVMLALVSWGLSEYAKSRDQQQQQADKEKAQAIADDKAKQDTLVKYLDDMSKSIEGDSSKAEAGANKSTGGSLLDAAPGSKTFIVAQSRTILALQSLDKKRQQLVIQFLKTSGLNRNHAFALSTPNGSVFSNPSEVKKMKPSSGRLLYQAQMVKANLANSDLSGVALVEANLVGANFGCVPPDNKEPEHCSFLEGVNFKDAQVKFANLSNAKLLGSDLSGADFWGANLNNADITGSNLNNAKLNEASLRGANFTNANLTGSVLWGADLTGANFSYSDLGGAILLFTDLADAENLTQEELTGKDAPLLCNVRLPKYIKGIDPYRDCDRMPQKLVNRSLSPDLQSAQKDVNELRQQKFK